MAKRMRSTRREVSSDEESEDGGGDASGPRRPRRAVVESDEESEEGGTDGSESDGGMSGEYDRSLHQGGEEGDVSNVEAAEAMDVEGAAGGEAELRRRVLYSGDAPDWAEVQREAEQIGCDDAWLQAVKKKRSELHAALDQVCTLPSASA